jgi:hypothetical protein
MGLLAKGDDGQKPLWRKFVARQKKLGIKPSTLRDVVESIRLSGSEEWILIEGSQAIAMINAESKIGQSLWETVTQFEGNLKALEIVFATGKLGFDLEPSDTLSGYWSYDEETEKVEFSDGEIKKTSTGLSGLSLESMTLPSPSVNAQPQQKNTTRVRAAG